MTRAATSTSSDGAAPHSAEPAANSSMPARNVRLRPARSAIRPAGIMSAAMTIAYAFSTHDIAAGLAPSKSPAMCGNAMFTMNRSRLTMNTATETTVRTCQRRSTFGLLLRGCGCILQAASRQPRRGSCRMQPRPSTVAIAMPHRPFPGQNCSIAGALEIVGERWTLLVMREVLLGRRRFGDIRSHLGVAPNILSDRLATLVEHGLLEHRERARRRRVRADPQGRRRAPGARRAAAVGRPLRRLRGRPAARLRARGAVATTPTRGCTAAHCGESLRAGDLQVRPGPGANAAQLAEPLLPRR